jgi:hypothetical protein
VGIDWSTIQHQHVISAADSIISNPKKPLRETGLFVVVNGQRLPAKQLLRSAYCLANRLPLGAAPKFASGEATLNVFKRLGFAVERVVPSSNKAQIGP